VLISLDLRSVWDWNVKNVYLGVFAEYEAEGMNQAVMIWDTVITHQKDANINRTAQTPKYLLKDNGRRLRGKKVTLKVFYNVFPHAGVGISGNVGSSSFFLPDEYMRASQ